MKFVIACSKTWCSNIMSTLIDEENLQFTFIDNKKKLTISYLDKLKPDYIFFPHWSYKVPKEIYTKYECVIFHMTDLPFGRGGSPLQNLIIRGHTVTMLSALKCADGLDAGPIYLKEKLSLLGNADEIFFRASLLIESMILEIISNRIEPTEQIGQTTTFLRRTEKDNDFSNVNSLDEVFDYIRMLDSKDYKPAFVEIGEFKFEFNDAIRKKDYIHSKVKISKK